MRIDLDWTADSRDPLFLRAPIAPALPVARDDVGAVLKGLDALGYYDAEAGGIPPRSPSVVHDAIERFQADHGLARDGVMQPDGPTLRTLNRIFEARREEKFREEQDAAAAARTAAGRPSPIALTGQNNAVVGPHPAADDVNDGNASSLYAQLRQQERRIPPPQQQPPRRGGVTPRPAPQRQAPQRPAPAQPPAPQGPADQRQPWREWAPMRETRGPTAEGDVEYWNALNQDRALGARAREVFDIMSYLEGGATIDRQGSVPVARGGITQPTLNAARDPRSPLHGMLRNVQTPAQLTPEHRVAITRFFLDREMGRAGASRGITGTQVIDDIGNRPYAGARETATIVADSFLRWGPGQTIRNIRESVNEVIRRLGNRAPAGLQPLPATMNVFGGQALAAIETLIDSGHGNALHAALAARYLARAVLPGDEARARFHRSLRLTPEGSQP